MSNAGGRAKPRRRLAYIYFENPADADPAIAELEKRGFAVKVRYAPPRPPMFPEVKMWIGIASEIELEPFIEWVASTVEPLHGSVTSAGYDDPVYIPHDLRRHAGFHMSAPGSSAKH